MGTYQVDTDGGTYQIETEDQAPSLLENAGKDVVDIGRQVKEGAYDLPKDIHSTLVKGITDLVAPKSDSVVPGVDVPKPPNPIERRAADIGRDPVGMARELVRPVTHPVDYFKEHPLIQTLNAAGAAAAGKGLLDTVRAPAGAPEAVIPPEETPPPTPGPSAPPEPPKTAPEPPPSAPQEPAADVPPGTPPASGIADDANKVWDQVKGYATKAYDQQAQKPGWPSTVADYVQEKSQMMANQQLGATPLQARQIGHEGMRSIGQYALDNGIVSPTNGLRGMMAKNSALLKSAGETLGKLREEADTLRNPKTQPIDVLQEVRARLDAKYARGAHSGEAGLYGKALEDLADADASHQGLAEVATKLNKAANEANRLKQPHSAFTDVANTVSDINNERIKSILGTQKAAQYEQALREFGVNKKISSFLERKAAGEVKRFGPGSATSNMLQKAMDEFGYKYGAKAANKLSGTVLKNPGIARSLPAMFKEFIHHVEAVGDEPAGMAYGGVVPDDVARYVTSR